MVYMECLGSIMHERTTATYRSASPSCRSQCWPALSRSLHPILGFCQAHLVRAAPHGGASEMVFSEPNNTRTEARLAKRFGMRR